MLNRAARFFPILRALRSSLAAEDSLLEVGSGSLGVGEFWNRDFIGCDLAFPSPPARNVHAVRCSGHQLPFPDISFDGVVVSDVMEHVPPGLRKEVISEVLRVSRKIVVFGYPCGKAAFELDQRLYRDYQRRNIKPPVWLEEHMLHAFPDEELFADLPQDWKKQIFPNESLRFHLWMMRTEMFRPWNYALRLFLRIMPRAVERILRHADREPSYRKIFVLERES